MSKNLIEERKYLTDIIIEQLKPHMIIHRYDAYTTNSIYLKFDYGVANSLRISDHPGKQHLKYRFNLMVAETGAKRFKIERDGFPMYFYSPDHLDLLIEDILKGKADKISYYKNYEAVLKAAFYKIDRTKTFWLNAIQIN